MTFAPLTHTSGQAPEGQSILYKGWKSDSTTFRQAWNHSYLEAKLLFPLGSPLPDDSYICQTTKRQAEAIALYPINGEDNAE